MTTRFAPYRRVQLLSMTLMALMLMVLGIALYGVNTVKTDFSTLAEEDLPRFDQLLHIDRDLYRAERALEVALAATDGPTRIDALSQYRRDIEDITTRWDAYLAVSPGGAEEIQWQREYEVANAEWIARSDALADAIENGATSSDPEAVELLHRSQSAFDVLRTVVHEFEINVAEPYIERALDNVSNDADRTILELGMLSVVGLGLAGLVSVTSFRSTKLDFYRNRDRDEAQAVDAQRSFFDSELSQAMEMARTEASAIDAVGAALDSQISGRSTQLMLADSSQAHLTPIVVSPAGEHRGCGVTEPSDCPAVRRGTPLEFTDGGSFSACPHLRHEEPDRSAFCVPVSIAGRSAGVLHSTSEPGERVDEETAFRLELISTRVGDRIGVLRAFAQSETQASTDPLTGLNNRRSFENKAQDRLRRGEPMAIAYGDLDHFKRLNDTHGHGAGDRALRLFSKVVTDSLRDTDLAARWGGEEFVIAFGHLDAEAAAAVLERLRQNLIVALAGADVPPFTVSFGVVDSLASSDLEDLVRLADDSLNEAKRRGRDQVLVSGRWPEVPTNA